jgi:outer membrane protein OmpA-like peptidoglycan-associated protein
MPLGSAPAVRPPSPLEAERDWLLSWFKDTPVRISTLPTGALEVEVPLEFCFESGRSRLLPALIAVLDKVAQSLRREDDARLAVVAAATDEGGAPGLALLRATQVRSHLVSRGVGSSQLSSPSAQATRSVLLRMVTPAP